MFEVEGLDGIRNYIAEYATRDCAEMKERFYLYLNGLLDLYFILYRTIQHVRTESHQRQQLRNLVRETSFK